MWYYPISCQILRDYAIVQNCAAVSESVRINCPPQPPVTFLFQWFLFILYHRCADMDRCRMKTLMGKMQIWSNQIYSFPDSFIEHLPNCSHGKYWRERIRHPMLSAALRVEVQAKSNTCYVLHIMQEYITIHLGRLTFGTIFPSEIKQSKKRPPPSLGLRLTFVCSIRRQA